MKILIVSAHQPHHDLVEKRFTAVGHKVFHAWTQNDIDEWPGCPMHLVIVDGDDSPPVAATDIALLIPTTTILITGTSMYGDDLLAECLLLPIKAVKVAKELTDKTIDLILKQSSQTTEVS